MAYTNPAVADFKNQFFRDFPYGTDLNLHVLDQDIASAFVLTNMAINSALWPDQGSYTYGYLLLTAHYLLLNLRASSQGLNGQYNFLQNQKSVAAVSESFTIPQRIIDNPLLSGYMKTHYGAQYLNALWPQLVGQMFSVCRVAQP